MSNFPIGKRSSRKISGGSTYLSEFSLIWHIAQGGAGFYPKQTRYALPYGSENKSLLHKQEAVPPKGGDTMDKLLLLIAVLALAIASVATRVALLQLIINLLK